MGKKLIIVTLTTVAMGCGAAGLAMNSKKLRMKRMLKKAGNFLGCSADILQALSCQLKGCGN